MPTRPPACMAITAEEQAQYLALLTSGVSSYKAARQVNPAYTGRLFRSLAHHDPEFGDLLEQAKVDNRDVFREKLRDRIWDRALSPEPDADKIATTVARCELDEFAVLNQQRVELTGRDAGPIEVEHKERLTLDDVARFARQIGLGADAGGELPAAGGVLPAPADD